MSSLTDPTPTSDAADGSISGEIYGELPDADAVTLACPTSLRAVTPADSHVAINHTIHAAFYSERPTSIGSLQCSSGSAAVAEDEGLSLSSVDLRAAREWFSELTARSVPTIAVLPDGVLGLCIRSPSIASDDAPATPAAACAAAFSAAAADTRITPDVGALVQSAPGEVGRQVSWGHSTQHRTGWVDASRCACRLPEEAGGAAECSSGGCYGEVFELSPRLDCVDDAGGASDAEPLLLRRDSSAAPSCLMRAADDPPRSTGACRGPPQPSAGAAHALHAVGSRVCLGNGACWECEQPGSAAAEAAAGQDGRCGMRGAGVGGGGCGCGHRRDEGRGQLWQGAGAGAAEPAAERETGAGGAGCDRQAPEEAHMVPAVAACAHAWEYEGSPAVGLVRYAECAVQMDGMQAVAAQGRRSMLAAAGGAGESAAVGLASAETVLTSEGAVEAAGDVGAEGARGEDVGGAAAGADDGIAATYYFYRKTLCMDDFAHALGVPCLSMQHGPGSFRAEGTGGLSGGPS